MLGGISGAGHYSTYYMNPYRTVNRSAAARQNTAPLAEQARRTAVPAHSWAASRPSNLETPVQPVDAVKRVNPDAQPAGIDLPFSVRQGADPAEMAVRMRITAYQDEDSAEQPGFPSNGEDGEPLPGIFANEKDEAKLGIFANEKDDARLGIFASEEDDTELGIFADEEEDGTDSALGAEDAQKAAEEGECQTCERRKYQDGSDDMSVSFQSPTNIKPEQVASAVRGHEMEHVLHEQAKAKREGRKVVSQSVTLHTAICPECGKVYISGGETRTTTKANPERIDEEQEEQEPLRKSFSIFG